METKTKIKIVVKIAIVIIVIIIVWGGLGRIALHSVKNFNLKNEEGYYLFVNNYDTDTLKFATHSEESEPIEISERIFELLKEKLKYKSMAINFGLRDFPALTLYHEEYRHFYINYYPNNEDYSGRHYTFNISSQEDSSYLDFNLGIINIRIQLKHDDVLTDYLHGLFVDA